MKVRQIGYQLVVFDDLRLLELDIFGNDAFVTKEQPLGEIVELLTFVGGRMHHLSQFYVADVLE